MALSKCPRCGNGPLFDGFLALQAKCSSCGLDYDFADAGDGPAFFVVIFSGAIVVVGAILLEFAYQPPYWVHAAIWVPMTLFLCIVPLRPLKAMMIHQQYRKDAHEGRRL